MNKEKDTVKKAERLIDKLNEEIKQTDYIIAEAKKVLREAKANRRKILSLKREVSSHYKNDRRYNN